VASSGDDDEPSGSINEGNFFNLLTIHSSRIFCTMNSDIYFGVTHF
jgi:hypothetical protein